MSNLFSMGPQQPQPQMNPMPNQNGSFIDQLTQFANSLKGDPNQLLNALLESGQMSRQQYEYLSKQASQIQTLFGLR